MKEVKDYHKMIYSREWNSFKDPDVPEYFNPTVLLLDNNLSAGYGDKTALIVDNQSYTYTDLFHHVCRAANGMASLNLEPENRILLFGTDSLNYIATWFGAIRNGIIPAVISDAYKAENLLYFLCDTACKVLFIDQEQIEKFNQISDEIPHTLKIVIVNGNLADVSETGDRQTLRYFEMVEGHSSVSEPYPIHKNDITYMFYSGGTTGTAKGITHLAHDFYLVPERHGKFLEYCEEDIVYATSKKYFTHGLWPGLLIPLYFGATSVVSQFSPSPENVVKLVETNNPTKMITVPTIIKNIILFSNQNRIPDFSSLQVVTSASEKMPPEVFERFYELFGLEIHDSIGSSEITYEWIANRPKDFRRGSLGKPVFGFEVKLMDTDDNEIQKPNVDGEAWIKSKTTCFFYWRKLDKTRETFIGEWARTGDTLRYDEDGFFWFSGRSDDVFKVKGLWVSPIEVEAAITEDSAVLEAAVVSYEDGAGLTKPKAFVVLNPGEETTDELIEQLKNRVRQIGGYKVPQEFIFVEALPRTTLMKIDRRALRDKKT